jgi:hypothetical protein
VEAEPTANATPMIESAWKLSAYAIMTIPVMAIIAATICQEEWKKIEKKLFFVSHIKLFSLKFLSTFLSLITSSISLFKGKKSQY